MSESDTPVRIELLYIRDCPSYKQVWNDLAEVVVGAGLNASVHLIGVNTREQADALRFAGSPTVKVNGYDLEDYAGLGVLACRLYPENGSKGWPSKALLKRALAAAKPPLEAR